MSLTVYNIKKWYRMLTGNSILHVNQDIGRQFSSDSLKGYYNNLTEKVTRQPELIDTESLPTFSTADGRQVLFPVAIFQYGLGAYDLYLASGKKDKRYLRKFMECAGWAVDNQEQQGAWNNFFFLHPQDPYGAMAQGEGASLLLRAYVETKEQHFLASARQAVDFMLKPLREGGTSDGDVLLEYTHLPAVMNGWIFAWWGLYDYVTVVSDKTLNLDSGIWNPNGYYKERLEKSCKALEEKLPEFSSGYWSMYDLAGHIASPFYHHLHIAQMQAMYQLTRHDIFAQYAERWQRNEDRRADYARAFIKKTWQKLREP